VNTQLIDVPVHVCICLFTRQTSVLFHICYIAVHVVEQSASAT